MGRITVNDQLTTAGAGAALVSPLWLPTLQNISDGFTIFLPILGGIWLVVQIITKILEFKRKRDGA